jgi:hypothetical protein
MLDKDFELKMQHESEKFRINGKVRMGTGSDAIYGRVLKINRDSMVIKWEDLRDPTLHHPETYHKIKIVS